MDQEHRIWEVGGSLRDRALGIDTKDHDFAFEIVLPPRVIIDAYVGYDIMREWLIKGGYQIFTENAQYVTVRAHFPRNHPQHGKTTADFVLCRRDGEYLDGRRPSAVMVGNIHDDLKRRDFTCNAMAQEVTTGVFLDPYDGMNAIVERRLVCVGNAKDRFTEDALRALRAIRFAITRDMTLSSDILWTLNHAAWLPPLVRQISVERKHAELDKMFSHNTLRSMELLSHEISYELRDAIFAGGLRLFPTLKKT